ncbi:MAG: GspH/FimT family pseudopilin [Parvularculaceae bacterium]|nr:GspH/FimT family pseudopilin [Parvularculaceae bacterium]
MDRRQIAKRRQRGLTLVELLVVIVIIALAASVVMLNAPPSRPDVRDDAERFAARLMLAFDEAVAADRVLRLDFDAAGYEFAQLDEGDWKPVDDIAALARHAFHRRTSALIEVEDAANANAFALGDDVDQENEEETDDGLSTIILDPLGAQIPFRVKFSSADGVWTVVVDETAKVSVTNDA